MSALDIDVYASSSASAVRSRRRLYAALLARFSSRPFPLTVSTLRQLGAGLKAGRYRSAPNVISQYRVDAERSGQSLSGAVLRAATDVTRACTRGLGPPARATPLPFSRLGSLPGGATSWIPLGPLGCRNAMVCGSWWMLRETELSNLRARFAQLDLQGVPTACLTLPASKTDHSAQGVRRTHACICTAGRPTPLCPVHALWDQLWILKRSFPERFSGDLPDASLPLFPRADSKPATKDKVTDCIRHAARALQVPLQSRDGSTQVSGHSLRPTGAQGLCRAGLDTWAVQLIGRWGSSVVRQYVADAAVSAEAAISRRGLLGHSLRELARETSNITLEELRTLAAEEVASSLALQTSSFSSAVLAELLPSLRDHVLSEREKNDDRSQSSDTSSESSSDSETSGDERAPAQADGAADLALLCHETVTSTSTGRKHRILVGPSNTVGAGAWVSMCGWRFGRVMGTRDSLDTDLKCRKCFP